MAVFTTHSVAACWHSEPHLTSTLALKSGLCYVSFISFIILIPVATRYLQSNADYHNRVCLSFFFAKNAMRKNKKLVLSQIPFQGL